MLFMGPTDPQLSVEGECYSIKVKVIFFYFTGKDENGVDYKITQFNKMVYD